MELLLVRDVVVALALGLGITLTMFGLKLTRR